MLDQLEENGAPSESRRRRALGLLAWWTYKYSWWVILAGVVLAVASLVITKQRLGFRTSRDDLISPSEQYVRVYRAYQREFDDKDDVVIVVEHPDLRRSKAFARALAQHLEHDPEAAREVLYRIDPSELGGRALMYLSPAELQELKGKLEEYRDVIDAVAAEPRVAVLLRAINREISSALVGHLVSSFLGVAPPDGQGERRLDLSLLRGLIRSFGDALEGQPYRSVWREMLRPGSDMDEDGFLVDENRRLLFVLVVVPEDASALGSAAAAIARVRQHVAAVRQAYPEVQVGITGGPALDAEEMQVSVKDTTLASVLALAGVGLCFVLFYRDVARPLLAVVTLALGLAWSFGFTTLTVGHLSILTVVFATILIGMSDDFGVHLISRFEEEIGLGHSIFPALRRTFVYSGGGIVSSGVTFAIAFLAMTLTQFLGIGELGLIGGSGVLLCMIAMLTVFPASLVLYEKWKANWLMHWLDVHLRLPRTLAEWQPQMIDRLYRWPRPLLVGAGVLTAVGLIAIPRVGMDFNLLRLQAQGTESVKWELKIINQAHRSSWYAVSVAPTIAAARRLEAAYERLPQVSRVETIAALIPADQPARMRAVAAVRPAVEALPEIEVQEKPVDVQEVHALLQAIRFKLQEDKEEGWNPARKPLAADLRAVRAQLARVEPLLGRSDPRVAERRLALLQRNMFLDAAEQIDFLKRNTHTAPITLASVPAALKRRFIGNTGRFLVQIFPARNIWDREPLGDFVTALRRVDARVTGGPVSFFESSRLMRDGYIEAGLYSLAAICLLLLYDFRNLRFAALALVPLGVGAVWTVGAMWLTGLRFNLANLIILPLIVGIGVSNGIHIIHRHLENGSHEMSVIARSTGKAVVLSSLTTMVGFGSLMVARHQGIFSLGLLLTLGIGCNLLASLTVLPALLSYLPVEAGQAQGEGEQARAAA